MPLCPKLCWHNVDILIYIYCVFYLFSHLLHLIFYAIIVSMHPICKALNKQKFFRALDIGRQWHLSITPLDENLKSSFDCRDMKPGAVYFAEVHHYSFQENQIPSSLDYNFLYAHTIHQH